MPALCPPQNISKSTLKQELVQPRGIKAYVKVGVGKSKGSTGEYHTGGVTLGGVTPGGVTPGEVTLGG